MAERIYLTLDDSVCIHDQQLKLYGGAEGVRDEGLILSALLRPQTGYYADVIEEAAALWESLTMNHGFIDGNKRVAYACLELILQANGADVTATNGDAERFFYAHLG